MEQHPHQRIAERLWNAIAAGEVERVGELVDEKCVWRMPGRSAVAGTYSGTEEILHFMAYVGELTNDLSSELLDVFVNDRGAVMRYRVRAARGSRRLDMEHLLMLSIENERISEAVFAPIDQAAYDRFFSPP